LVLDSVKDEGGTEKLVPAFAMGLDRTRFEPHVICFENSERLDNLSRHVRTAAFPLNRVYSPAGLGQIWKFREYIRRNGIDLVHSFMWKSDIFNVVAALGLRRTAVITSRLNSGYLYTAVNKRVSQVLNVFTTRVVTNSVHAAKVVEAAERLRPEKLTVLYPGVDLGQYACSAGDPATAAALGIPSDVRVVGVVANYREVKDLPLFLRAAQKVAAVVPDAVFLLVGSGEMKEELERLAAELKIGDRVFFTDGKGPVPDYLARMSVACLSSLSEGLPNAILEYMAAGLPVVATDVGGNPELVTDGVSGCLVRCRTPEAFAEPVIRLLQDEKLRVALGRKGLERVTAEFDMAGAVRRLENFYIEVAEETRNAPRGLRRSVSHARAR
jgi:glycosyltransferase involved in cell wall biosynthesis